MAILMVFLRSVPTGCGRCCWPYPYWDPPSPCMYARVPLLAARSSCQFRTTCSDARPSTWSFVSSGSEHPPLDSHAWWATLIPTLRHSFIPRPHRFSISKKEVVPHSSIRASFVLPLFLTPSFPARRFSISQMDVVPRQSYVSGIVPAEERTATMGITNIVRSLGAACGPLVVGFLSAGGHFG